jgi:hypothetical protein
MLILFKNTGDEYRNPGESYKENTTCKFAQFIQKTIPCFLLFSEYKRVHLAV